LQQFQWRGIMTAPSNSRHISHMSLSGTSCRKTRRAEIKRKRRSSRLSRKHWNLTTAWLLIWQTGDDLLQSWKRRTHILLLLVKSFTPPPCTLISKQWVTRMKAWEDNMLGFLTNNQKEWRRGGGDGQMQIPLLIFKERTQLKIRERSRKRSSNSSRWRRHIAIEEGIPKMTVTKKVTVIFISQWTNLFYN